MGKLSEAFSIHNNLKSITLSGNAIGDAGAKALASYLKDSKTLEFLDVSNNNIRDQGLIELSKALSSNHSLKDLMLGGDTFYSCNVFQNPSLYVFVNALNENDTLKKVSFSHMTFKTGFSQISRLIKNDTLTDLNLSYCSIENKKMKKIAKALCGNRLLVNLNLSHNEIQNKGAMCLGAAYLFGPDLQSLNLSDNNIGDKGCQTLMKGLHHKNVTLKNALFTCSLEKNPKINFVSKEAFQRIAHKKEEKNFLLFGVDF